MKKEPIQSYAMGIIQINDKTPFYTYVTGKKQVIELPLNGWAHCSHAESGVCSICHSGYLLFDSKKGSNYLDEIWSYITTNLMSADSIDRVRKTGKPIEINIPPSLIKPGIIVL